MLFRMITGWTLLGIAAFFTLQIPRLSSLEKGLFIVVLGLIGLVALVLFQIRWRKGSTLDLVQTLGAKALALVGLGILSIVSAWWGISALQGQGAHARRAFSHLLLERLDPEAAGVFWLLTSVLIGAVTFVQARRLLRKEASR